MRLLLSLLLLGLLGVASALSASGNRLLVVLEELAEKEKYGKFFGDLKGKLELDLGRCEELELELELNWSDCWGL
jgi:hypothetical protein